MSGPTVSCDHALSPSHASPPSWLVSFLPNLRLTLTNRCLITSLWRVSQEGLITCRCVPPSADVLRDAALSDSGGAMRVRRASSHHPFPSLSFRSRSVDAANPQGRHTTL